MVVVAHLVRRFFGSLRFGGPSDEDERWVSELLSPAELLLWQRMSDPDRRHGVGVARRVEHLLAPDRADRAVLVAALLHDVGKTEAGLGTAGRVLATLCIALVERSVASSWSDYGGWRGRVGRYARHPDRGAELLSDAGSHPLIAAWAAEHHLRSRMWSIPTDVGETLRAADND